MKGRNILLIGIMTALLLIITVSCSMGTGDAYVIPLVEELGGKNRLQFTDPTGDTIGFENFQYDILSVDMFTDEDDSYFIMHIRFNNPVHAPKGGLDMVGLVGFLEIDADRDPATGFPPSINSFIPNGEPLSNMGVDYTIQFFEYDGLFHTLPIYESEFWTLMGYANIIYGETSCTLQIPFSALPDRDGYDNDGSIDFGFVLGTQPEPTDVAHEGLSYTAGL
jgi:hypothetical protein